MKDISGNNIPMMTGDPSPGCVESVDMSVLCSPHQSLASGPWWAVNIGTQLRGGAAEKATTNLPPPSLHPAVSRFKGIKIQSPDLNIENIIQIMTHNVP